MENTEKITVEESVISNPDIRDLLKCGVQFGHEKNRWNPKMKEYIFGLKNNILIIDLEQTLVSLNNAIKFLTESASKGPILFVGTKRQARDIVKKYAVNSGSYFITYRWLGGLLSNFKMIKKSLQKFRDLEDEFEKGVVNRTKFEVNQMKKEWERMNRIYGGIKNMDRYPVAIVLVDCNFEKGALLEAKAAKIPVVSMVDTNSDPTDVDYVIPSNDDAIKSINLIMGALSEAVKKGNKGIGVKHDLKDFSQFNIQIIKKVEQVVEDKLAGEDKTVAVKESRNQPQAVAKKSFIAQKGILEKVKDEANTKIQEKIPAKKAIKTEVKPEKTKPIAKTGSKPVKKPVAKSPKKSVIKTTTKTTAKTKKAVKK